MSNDFGSFGSPPNPYASPSGAGASRPPLPNTGKIVAPGIALAVVGGIGLVASIFNIVWALTVQPEVNPQAPEWLQEMQRESTGGVAAGIQALFVLLNLLIIAGGVQMSRISTWPFALTASILAMVNLGTCCCVIGIPIGIWSIVILAQEDVRQLFRMRAEGRA